MKLFAKTRDFAVRVIMGANVAVIIVMLFIGYSGRINPETSPVLSSMGLLFPVALAANFCFLVLWIFVRLRFVALPLLGYVMCYSPVRTYCPVNIPKDAPGGSIKVLSYNVHNYNNISDDEDAPSAMEYVKYTQADIVCLQEASINDKLRDCLGDTYQYLDSLKGGDSNTSSVLLLSKFPIVKKERIQYPSKGNLSGAFFLKVGNGTVIVINNHLESNGLSMSERDNFRKIVHGDAEKDTLKMESKRLVVKLAESAKIRAVQINAVADFVRKHKGESMILCGDFNENPISYTHYTIAKELTDCYVESGNGPGWSYNQNSMKVRIDNIFCSDDWTPYSCNIDSKIGASDHYPMCCWLKKRDNQ